MISGEENAASNEPVKPKDIARLEARIAKAQLLLHACTPLVNSLEMAEQAIGQSIMGGKYGEIGPALMGAESVMGGLRRLLPVQITVKTNRVPKDTPKWRVKLRAEIETYRAALAQFNERLEKDQTLLREKVDTWRKRQSDADTA